MLGASLSFPPICARAKEKQLPETWGPLDRRYEPLARLDRHGRECWFVLSFPHLSSATDCLSESIALLSEYCRSVFSLALLPPLTLSQRIPHPRRRRRRSLPRDRLRARCQFVPVILTRLHQLNRLQNSASGARSQRRTPVEQEVRPRLSLLRFAA